MISEDSLNDAEVTCRAQWLISLWHITRYRVCPFESTPGHLLTFLVHHRLHPTISFASCETQT